MKKVLLASTALVAAAAFAAPAIAADKVKLSVSGYFTAAIAVPIVDEDDFFGGPLAPGSDIRPFRLAREAEVYFRGKTTLDNGLEIGARFELESDENGGDVIDEAFIHIKGGFGEIQFGAQDGVGDQMPVVAPTPFVEIFANDADLDPLGNDDGGILTGLVNTVIDASSDNEKIIYFTPRFGGFQLGISYAPEGECEEQEFTSIIDNDRADHCAGGTTSPEDAWEFGLNYEGEFGDVSVEGSFVYLTGDVPGGSVDDWALGLAIGFGAFKIGGAYAEKETDGLPGDPFDHYNLGATYTTGPWTFGLEWGRAEWDVTDLEQDRFVGGFAYDFGPGMTLTFGGVFTQTEQFGGAVEGDGFALFSEFGISF